MTVYYLEQRSVKYDNFGNPLGIIWLRCNNMNGKRQAMAALKRANCGAFTYRLIEETIIRKILK